jgi:hypothetical protein
VTVACFLCLLFTTCELAAWLSFAYLASGSPLPRVVVVRGYLFMAMSIAVCTYFKWPYVAALVGWTDVVLIALRVLPWVQEDATELCLQFSFDIVFFLASQCGLLLWVRRNRHFRGPDRDRNGPDELTNLK